MYPQVLVTWTASAAAMTNGRNQTYPVADALSRRVHPDTEHVIEGETEGIRPSVVSARSSKELTRNRTPVMWWRPRQCSARIALVTVFLTMAFSPLACTSQTHDGASTHVAASDCIDVGKPNVTIDELLAARKDPRDPLPVPDSDYEYKKNIESNPIAVRVLQEGDHSGYTAAVCGLVDEDKKWAKSVRGRILDDGLRACILIHQPGYPEGKIRLPHQSEDAARKYLCP